MAKPVGKIDSREALKAWFVDKPPEFAQVVAARVALRVLPLTLRVIELPGKQFTTRQKKQFILSAFRANFISWAARKYPADDVSAPTATSYDNAAADVAAASFTAANTAYAAAYAASYAATTNTSFAYAADAAVAAADAVAAGRDIWRSIQTDAEWLESSSTLPGELINEPLWLYDVRGDSEYEANSPDWARGPFVAFIDSEFAKDGRWRPWIEWYRAILPDIMEARPWSLFGERPDIVIATRGEDFWDREPDDVLDDIYRIVGGVVSEGFDVAESYGTVGPPPAAVREAVRTVSDEPTREDQLGRRYFAEALVERMDDIHRAGGRDGFAVHLHAPWGSGKTSILMMMEEVMSRQHRPTGERWAVIDFNAWENERRNPPWWPMIEQLKQGCENSLLSGPTPQRASAISSRWYWWLLLADWFPYLLAVIVVASVAYILSNQTGNNQTDLIGAGSDILKLIAALAAFWVTFIAAGRTLVWGSSNTSKFYDDLSRDPLERIRKLFKTLVETTGQPVCIFIDDLDRCNADYVVDLLEGIQTAFRHKKVAYVIAADRTWIKAAFEARYDTFAGDVGDAGQPLGYLFLEKIFQVSTPIPGMGRSEKSSYWDGLINRQTGDAADSDIEVAEEKTIKQSNEEFDDRVKSIREKITPERSSNLTSQDVKNIREEYGDSPESRAAAMMAYNSSGAALAEAEHLLSQFVGDLPDNPRVMKRMINAFGMRQNIGILEANDIPPGVLARWTILEQRWPALADLLINKPQHLDVLKAEVETTAIENLDEAIKPFVNSPDIIGVIGTGEVALTTENVRSLTRGSAN